MNFQSRSWPECVGMTGEEAKAKVLKDFPNAHVSILKDGSPVTEDYKSDRVRIFINDEGKVSQEPITA